MSEPTPSHPWYREPYVWLVLSPLIAVIIAGFWTLGLAIQHDVTEAMPGEYHKAGKLIALDEAALRRSLRVAGVLSGRIDRQARKLWIEAGDAPLPHRLQALFVHPTRSHLDLGIELERSGRGYVATLPAQPANRGELHVFPEDYAWRVVASLDGRDQLEFSASRR